MIVSTLSLLFMGVSALLSIGVPVCLLIFFHKKYSAKIAPALVGAAVFVLFAMVLEQVMHYLVLRPGADGSIALKQRPIWFMLYGSFAAGIFEETARYLSYRLLHRKYDGVRTALSYGVGHGGIESILIGGIAMVSSLVVAIMAGSGGASALTQNAALAAQVQTLATVPPYMFLMSGIERMLALAIQISLSVLVFYSVYASRKLWLYPAAILLHAAIDAPAALMQTGVLNNVFVLEGMVLAFAVCLVALAVYTHKRLKPAPEPEPDTASATDAQ